MTATTTTTIAVEPPRLDDAWGDERVAALADVVFQLALEVFQLRMEASGANDTLSEEQRLDAARQFVTDVFAPFTDGQR